jgi:hypothetical protein
MALLGCPEERGVAGVVGGVDVGAVIDEELGGIGTA